MPVIIRKPNDTLPTPTPAQSTKTVPDTDMLENMVLRVPQARVLAVLVPEDVKTPVWDWPLFTRAALATKAGYTTISGTVTRVLNGIHPGSSSGDAHQGLIARGLIKEITLDVEGVKETNYQATPLGVRAYQMYVAAHGELPKHRNKNACINDRYKKKENQK